MHFEILVEDKSGSIAIDFIVKNLIGKNNPIHTYKIHPFKGIGKIPRNLKSNSNPATKTLLENLPRLIKAYGKSLTEIPAVVIVVLDLDKKDCIEFKNDLLKLYQNCNPKPELLFRLAIEEMEAWLLGDTKAIRKAFPKAKNQILSSYRQDSICDTWEKLADAIYPGGSRKLCREGFPRTGQVKCEWAEKIAPHLSIEQNQSKSFHVFVDSIKRYMNEQNQ